MLCTYRNQPYPAQLDDISKRERIVSDSAACFVYMLDNFII